MRLRSNPVGTVEIGKFVYPSESDKLVLRTAAAAALSL